MTQRRSRPARVATALGLRLELDLVEPRARRSVAGRAVDPVHSATAELEAAHLRALGARVAIDEPYQHYQYAGRADLLAWDLDARALLHIENRTHVMAGLWSAEVLHTLRLRTETCRALCPDPPDAFNAWWARSNPSPGESATFVVLDPFASGKQRMFIGLDDALTARPRVRGYVDAVSRLRPLLPD